MEKIKLNISDETLRDGLQQVGLFLTNETKRTLAQLIAQSGVHQIAVMPAIHETEVNLLQELIARGLTRQVVASCMMSERFIDQAASCGVQEVIVFHAVSDRLLRIRNPVIREQYSPKDHERDNADLIQHVRTTMVENVLRNLQYAKKQGLRICFAAEDASRADFEFLVECINTFKPYLESFLLCDTVSTLTPEKAYIWVHDLLQCTNEVPLAVHFHDDRGLALENTIQAVFAGATGISGTFGGIGERAGNVATEQVLHGLKARFGWVVDGIDYDVIDQIGSYLAHLGVRANPPYSPPTNRFESGIHVSALLRDPQSYAVFPHVEPDIWFGRCSGASNFQYLFEKHLQTPLTKQQYEKLRTDIKALSLQNKCSYSAAEILDLLDQGILKF